MGDAPKLLPHAASPPNEAPATSPPPPPRLLHPSKAAGGMLCGPGRQKPAAAQCCGAPASSPESRAATVLRGCHGGDCHASGRPEAQPAAWGWEGTTTALARLVGARLGHGPAAFRHAAVSSAPNLQLAFGPRRGLSYGWLLAHAPKSAQSLAEARCRTPRVLNRRCIVLRQPR